MSFYAIFLRLSKTSDVFTVQVHYNRVRLSLRPRAGIKISDVET